MSEYIWRSLLNEPFVTYKGSLRFFFFFFKKKKPFWYLVSKNRGLLLGEQIIPHYANSFFWDHISFSKFGQLK